MKQISFSGFLPKFEPDSIFFCGRDAVLKVGEEVASKKFQDFLKY